MINLYSINIACRQNILLLLFHCLRNRGISYCSLVLTICALGGCIPAAIIPPAGRISAINHLLIVPVEAPPLEVFPDPINTQMPVLTQYHYENIPANLLMSKKLYRNPGGILIAGLVSNEDGVPEAALRYKPVDWELIAARQEPEQPLTHDIWLTTAVLADKASSLLSSRQMKTELSHNYRRLDLAAENRTANLSNWRQAVKAWYAENHASADYRQFGIGSADTVLEVGVGSYRIFENQTSLQVLLKLIDLGTGQVVGRTEVQDISVEHSASAMLANNGDQFKSVITKLGTRLITDALDRLGLTGFSRSNTAELQAIAAENRP